MNRIKSLNALRALVACCLLACCAQAQEGGGTQPARKPAAKKPAPAKKTADAKTAPKTSQAKPAQADAAKQSAEKSDKTDKAAKSASAKTAAAGEAQPAQKLGEEEAKARLAEILKLPAWERVAELEDLLDYDLPDAVEVRAIEQLVSAEAAHGDERLRAGDVARGVELFKQAARDAPADMSEKLFVEVVSRFPTNLYLLGQRQAAFDVARQIERKSKDDPRRLLALAAFYLSIERNDEAVRLTDAAIKLAPDLAAAHLALGAARRQSLRLEEAASAYARALELDPKSAAARRSLADLRRATGRVEDALALYRELLAADPKDLSARTGVVLSLFDAGKREEAEQELEAALKENPKNLQLLAGAAYWHASRGDAARATDLAGRALAVEPRHPWAQIALARALVAAGRPLDAERALRYARLHARFPTLDYELASAMAAAGLYEEAAETLAQSFTLRGEEIEARLAGSVEARAADFVELLAPERRASFFQHGAADSAENARLLKSLLAFHRRAKASEGGAAAADAVRAANEFVSGEDALRPFRQLYAASRLLRLAQAEEALRLTEAARKGIDEALASPQAPVAALADELRDVRARAIAQGATPGVPVLPPNVLSNIVRGRLENLAGWALFNQGKAAEAVGPLRRAATVLPESTPYWRTAQWHLGAALAASGNPVEALAAYLKSYDRAAPDPARYAAIEALYRKVNGTLDGLDAKLGAKFEKASAEASPAAAPTPAPDAPAPEATPSPSPSPEATPSPETTTTPAVNPSPEATPSPSPTPEATPSATPSPTPEATPAPSPEAAPSPSPSTESSPSPTPSKTQESGPKAGPAEQRRVRRSHPPAGGCTLALSEEALTLGGGGSASFVVSLAGQGGDDAARVTATTPHWSDIIVVRATPAEGAPANEARFTVSSISKTTGNFSVAVKSPCGTKEIAVTVK